MNRDYTHLQVPFTALRESGPQSRDGERFAERALFRRAATCRLQRRSLFTYLSDLITAHNRDDPIPRPHLIPGLNPYPKPRGLRGFVSCAEKASNLHPVIPDQALNLAGQAVGRYRTAL